MSKIFISSTFGIVEAKPMALVDIHAVQPMADEENINNSSGNPLATAASDPAQDNDENVELVGPETEQ